MRLAIRVIVLVLAALLAGQLLFDAAAERAIAPGEHGGAGPAGGASTFRSLAAALPAASPYLAVVTSLALRSAGLIALVALPLLLVSLFSGRWFCLHVCPTGLLAEYAGRLRPGAASRIKTFPFLNRWLLLFVLGGAAVGYPLFVWMDPLSVFNGFFSAWRKPMTLAGVLPAAGLILVVGLSLVRPNAWCYRICPLGYSQEWLGKLGRRLRGPRVSPVAAAAGGGAGEGAAPAGSAAAWIQGRRGFLAAMAGAAVGGVMLHVFHRKAPPLRPPGAVTENRFTAVCARCGNCIRACPQRILRPDTGEAGLAGLLAPVGVIGPGYCAEWCNECTKVCPTGAIARLRLEEKKDVSIGTAVVTKSRCLAWAHGKACMVCDEYCPYKAVGVVEVKSVNCPEVDVEKCRGCGLCQTVCPAEETAIVVEGRAQRRLGKG